MVLRATGPAVAGSSRSTQGVRVSRSAYGQSFRSRKVTHVRSAVTETDVSETPKGTAVIGGFFAGLTRIGSTGTVQLKSSKEEKKTLATKDGRDDNVVFVAGATGRTGARVVRELLELGFTVRAGARSVEAAESALAVAATYGIIKPDQSRRVTVVPFDLGNVDGFAEAIGNANKVVCAVGAPEDQAFNFSLPKKIDGEGSIALINKAAELGVTQFVLMTSIGTGKLGWPSGILNVFGAVLLWKREAEKALETSGMAYTIVRPGGLERANDDFKRTHNLVLKPRDTIFGGEVSRLQVAELVAAACRNPAVAENKVLELVAEATAAPRSLEELMVEIPQDISREAQLSNKDAVDAARADLAAAQLKASQAAGVLLEADKRVSELAARLKEAKATEAAVKKDVAPLLKQVRPLEAQLADARKKAERAALLEQASKVVLEQARKAAGAGVLLSEKERTEIVEEVLNPKPATSELAAAPTAPQSSAKIFGFFGKKPEPAGPTDEEKAAAAAAEAAAAVEAEAAAAKAKAPVSVFGGLFTPRKIQVDETAAAQAEAAATAAKAEAAAAAAAAAAEAEAAAAKAKAPAPLFGGFFTPKPAARPPAPEPEVVVVKEELVAAVASPSVAEVVVEEPKPLFNVGSFFSGFKKRAEEQPQAEPEHVPEPVPQPAVAAAAAGPTPAKSEGPAPKPAPKPTPPKPAPDAADLADEEQRRRRVVEAAKAQLAAAIAAPSVPEPPAPAPVPAPAPASASAPAPAPAPALASASPKAEEPTPVKAEAPAAPQEAAPVVAEAPKPAKKNDEFDAEDAARRKAEAQAWIAAWKAGSTAGQNGAAAVAAETPAEEEVVEVVANPMSKFFSGLFN
ncbi:hypothetical protein VaNZ11_015011 [Volvox africanus]|uniref:NAD(P)-binding domain-containing protein n=1 Tax=Volvox africanus TaxID=51714 RepID=A0ABQ5SK92_9CHLO|nr:hypothetical protein VaNZ11_015011 [Volvox africanus]